MRHKRSLIDLQIEAQKYKTRSDFAKYNNACYRAAKKRLDFEDIVCHMDPSKTKSYTLEELIEEALKYKTRVDFKKYSNGFYQATVKRNDREHIMAHMKKSQTKAYTLKEIRLEANKYTKRSEFKKGNSSIYNAAWRKGPEFLDEICSHMDLASNSPYTKEEIVNEIDKHNTLESFYKGNPSIYSAALKMDDFKELIIKLKRQAGPSNPELEIYNAVKNIYPKTQTLRDRKVKIEGKPYINRFDIDVYVPELRKGIEFDGKYWHSEAGLKRSHPTWSDESIKNYHQLKDNHFLSKGIQILHIREEDWIKDREACICKCLEFLSF